MDSGEKGGEGSRGEKEKERKGEKGEKVEKEEREEKRKEKEEKEKGNEKVGSKEALRDSAREQSKDSCTGDEVRDRSVSTRKFQKYCPSIICSSSLRCRDLLLTAIWGEKMLVEGSL